MGNRASDLLAVAASVAARVAATAEHVEDAWTGTEIPRLTPEGLRERMDAAGHKFGGGFDGCEVCLEVVSTLPGVMAAQQQQQAAAEGAQ